MNQNNAISAIIEGEKFILFAEKAMYWEKINTLFIADLHLGKAGHFRKKGIPVPLEAGLSNFKQLDTILEKSSCKKIVFLGDLFHSAHNYECEFFLKWRSNHSQIEMSLVIGNHDILDSQFYEQAKLTLMEHLCINPFIFTHKPIDTDIHTDYYNIAGHVHPGIKLYGKARQSLSFSCFYFSKGFGLMPSFGSFTGNKVIAAQKEDNIYVIANNEVRKVL